MKSSLFSRRTHSDIEQAVELINRISASGEWPAIVYLLPFILAPEEEIAKTAGNGVELLLSGMRLPYLLQLDERLRGGMWTVPSHLGHWDTMKFSSLRKFTPGKTQVGVVGLSSFHRNGYVREAAVRHLSNMRDGDELPFLLIRLSDWVPQVRSVAEQAVEQRCNPAYLQHFVDNIALLERQKQRQRGGSRRFELLGRITSMLAQSQNRKVLFDGLQHQDYEVRRTCLKLLIETRGSDSVEIIRRIMRDNDVTNRRAAVELTNDLSLHEKLSVLPQLLADKAPSVRRLALNALCETRGAESRPLLEAALLDKSNVVREYARWKLTKLEAPIDFRQFYLDGLRRSRSDQVIAAATAGLGETGRPEDAPVILPLVDHQQVRIRKAAIRALARLDASNYAEVFLRLLANDSPGVSSAAEAALEDTIYELGGDVLWDCLTATSSWHVKRNVVRLLNRISKWDRISYLLLATSLGDGSVQELALKYVQAWEQQYRTTWQYSPRNAQQQDRFVKGFLGVRDVLPAPLLGTLQQCLVYAYDP